MQPIRLPDVAATEELATQIATALPLDCSGWMLLLAGDLGAGKSTLARSMLHAMGHDGVVPSPTYTLVEPYELQSGTVYHIDLYRISSIEDLAFRGGNDLRDGLILLEWPERVPELQALADLLVSLSYDGFGRTATVQALSGRAGALLDRIIIVN